MRRSAWGIVAVAALWACGGTTFAGGLDGGGDGGGSSSGSGSGSGGSGSSSGASSSGSGSSSGASSSGSGGSSSGSGGSSSSSGSGSSSGASSSSSGSGSSSGSSSGGPAPVYHRPDDSQCLGPAPAGTCNFGGSGGPGMCSDDSQCADAGANGRCIESNGGAAYCFCTSDACADDSACPKDQTCACHGSAYTVGEGNHCVPGNCRVDADCGAGGWCSPSYSTNGCGEIGGYYCHTPQDQCVNDSDCPTSNGPMNCSYDSGLRYWRCQMELLCG
jgi:hypothetical protein